MSSLFMNFVFLHYLIGEQRLTYIGTKHFSYSMCMHAKSLPLSPTLCDPLDCSPPGSSVHGILQARTLEWAALSPSGVFPTQGWNPNLLCLLHQQAGSSLLVPPGKPFLQYHFSRSVVSDSLQPHGLQPARLPCPSPTPGACSNSCPLSR